MTASLAQIKAFLVRNHISFEFGVNYTASRRQNADKSADIQFAIIGCARLSRAKALARDLLLARIAPNDTPKAISIWIRVFLWAVGVVCSHRLAGHIPLWLSVVTEALC